MDISYKFIEGSFKKPSVSDTECEGSEYIIAFSSYFSCLHQRSHREEHVAFHGAKLSLGARGGGHGVVDHGLSGGALDLCRALEFNQGHRGMMF